MTEKLEQPWHRVVVKVGTSTLTAQSDCLNPPRMVDLVRQLSQLRNAGADIVLVSSGAQQAGRERLGYPEERKSIPFKQMLAAVGQGRLMHLWEQYFDLYGIIVAQVLLTRQDIEDRQRYLNARDTLESLLERGIVPIVNENDAVATEEIKVGENDTLSAMVANVIEADLLVLLTDTDGLYTSDPSVAPGAELLERVDRVDEKLYDLAKDTRSELGTGGMYTKVLAADMATRGGTSVVIANGGRENVLSGIWSRTIPATWFPSRITPTEGRKRWLLAQSVTAGSVVVDEGAARAVMEAGRSLLPVGIVRVEGDFERGAIISVRRPNGEEIARGLSNYTSSGLRRILGQQSRDIGEILGYDYGPEFIHRDKLTLL
ncbi:MAG: glutamate 5-kinase [Chloroflexota bacterium]|nr:glutamate 5-kinase [Chloroflexota bacterium]